MYVELFLRHVIYFERFSRGKPLLTKDSTDFQKYLHINLRKGLVSGRRFVL
ncbi:unnamed protein product [Tenebrio molitor]|nr:unnamed protein product [Tenebrio molitor]